MYGEVCVYVGSFGCMWGSAGVYGRCGCTLYMYVERCGCMWGGLGVCGEVQVYGEV